MASSAARHTEKSESVKKEFLIFISIPVSIIVLVSAIVLGPSLFAKPKYNFIYENCPDYDCAYTYQVNGQGVITEQPSDNSYSSTSPVLYYFDASDNSSRAIDLTTARTYKLDNSNVSPDGYVLTQENTSDGGGFLLWGGSSNDSWYLKSGLKKKTVNIVGVNDSTDNITFLGWIKQ